MTNLKTANSASTAIQGPGPGTLRNPKPLTPSLGSIKLLCLHSGKCRRIPRESGAPSSVRPGLQNNAITCIHACLHAEALVGKCMYKHAFITCKCHAFDDALNLSIYKGCFESPRILKARKWGRLLAIPGPFGRRRGFCSSFRSFAASHWAPCGLNGIWKVSEAWAGAG